MASPFAAPIVDMRALGQLPDAYAQGQEWRQQQDVRGARKDALSTLFSDGGRGNYEAAMQKLFAAGDLEGGLEMGKMAQADAKLSLQRQRVAQGAGGGVGVYGTPIPYQKEDGSMGLGAIRKDGSFQAIEVPGAYSPGAAWQDFGTYRQPFNSKTGTPLGAPIPIDIEGEKSAEAIGKIQGEAAANLPNNIARADQAITTIDGLLTHPGLSTATGMSGQIDPRNYLAGTDAKDFQIALKQAQGQVFLDAYERLKGGGVITEIEGQKAEQAIARLDRAQSDDEFRRGLTDLREVIEAGKLRSQQKAGAGGGAGTTSDNPIEDAREAIRRGAPRDAVIQRLIENGYDPTGTGL